MIEILTESFCERCGTRYTFESTGRRWGSVTRLRVLSRGLRNLVMTDGLSAKDAMAAARMEEGRAASVEQLDAFHRTFNFCLGCRQYTCANCWNEPEGKCLTCAPDLSREVLPAAFPDLPSHGPASAVGADNGRTPIETWPTADLVRVAPAAAPAAEPEAAAEPAAAEPVAEPEAAAKSSEPSSTHVEATAAGLTEDELTAVAGALVARSASASADAAASRHVEEPDGSLAPAATAAPTPVDHVDPVAAGHAQTTSLLHRFRPQRRRLADGALEAPTARIPTIPTIPTVPPVPPPEAPGPAAPVDVVPQPTWRIVAPETTDAITRDTGRPTLAPPTPASGPFLRARPAPRPGGSPATPWAARLASARPAAGGVWAESSRDVLGPSGPAAPTGVQACVSCGLPLSANARFCRRCGTRQD